MNPVDETNADQPRQDGAWSQPTEDAPPPGWASAAQSSAAQSGTTPPLWAPEPTPEPTLPTWAAPRATWDDAPTTATPWATGAPAGVVTVPVRASRGRSRRGSAIVLVAALCLVSAVGGGVATIAMNGTGTTPAAAASSPDNHTVASVPTATPSNTSSSTPAPAVTTPSTTTPSGSTDENAVISVAKNVGPSVVTIQSTTTVSNPYQGTGQVTGTGSGVIVRSDGLILTNHHVVADAKTVQVLLSDGRILDGTVEGVDTLTDLALVKIDATGLPAAALGDSSAVQVGQSAIAIGSPLGEYPGSVTEGIVSGLDRTIDVQNDTTGATEHLSHLIQTDAAINPGNSGGPLLNSSGQVLGIDTAEAGNSQGIGFAIPINLAKPIIDQVAAGQVIARPWIGINYEPLTPAVAKQANLSVDYGAWIHIDTSGGSTGQTGTTAIVAGSPADTAGLKNGDIITAIDGNAIDTDHPLDTYLLSHSPGDKVTFTVLRGSSTISIDLTLGTRPATLG